MEKVKFKVLLWDPNLDCVEDYDVLPYFRNRYKESKVKPKTYDEFKQFIIDSSLYRFWSRCEYEIIITGWPVSKRKEKIDAHHQIKMNLDVICQILWNELQDVMVSKKQENDNIVIDENEFIYKGKTYVSKPESQACKGCAFIHPYCDGEDCSKPDEMPSCFNEDRKDHTNVVFIEKSKIEDMDGSEF